MIIQGLLEPPESWQSRIGFYLTIEDWGQHTGEMCQYCKEKTNTWRLQPEIEIEIFSNFSYIDEKLIEKRIRKIVEKWYTEKIICYKDECKRQHTNYLFTKVARKNWEITSAIHLPKLA